MTVQELLDAAILKTSEVMELSGRQAAQQMEIGKVCSLADAVLKLAQAQAVLGIAPPPRDRIRAVEAS